MGPRCPQDCQTGEVKSRRDRQPEGKRRFIWQSGKRLEHHRDKRRIAERQPFVCRQIRQDFVMDLIVVVQVVKPIALGRVEDGAGRIEAAEIGAQRGPKNVWPRSEVAKLTTNIARPTARIAKPTKRAPAPDPDSRRTNGPQVLPNRWPGRLRTKDLVMLRSRSGLVKYITTP